MLVSRIDRRFGAPIVRMMLPPRSTISSAFRKILSRRFRISQYKVSTRTSQSHCQCWARAKHSLPICSQPRYKPEDFFVTRKPMTDCKAPMRKS